MIKIVKPLSAPSASIHRYNIAGYDLLFQESVEALNAYLMDGNADVEMPSYPELKLLNKDNAQCVYQGRAPFEHRIQYVCFWCDGRVSQIDVAGVPVCQIDSAAQIIYLLNDQPLDAQLNLEVLTGPACILLMAQQQTICLHASAVATSAGNMLFIAESGSGKSTLSQHQGEFWNQLSDDISPLQLGSKVVLLTRFPQLKLSNSSVVNRIADVLPVDLIIRLGNRDCHQVEFTQLNSTEAFLQIVRHTVAAKLFSGEQLKTHAAFAQSVASQVPLVELNYPRDLRQLPALRQSIVDYLSSIKQA